MSRRFPLRLAVVPVLALAACSSAGSPDAPASAVAAPPPSPAARAPAARDAGCGPLFISPAGEPFRADPGDPAAPCPMRAWFAKADADGDGAITRTEFRNDALRFFAVLDVDGNGYIDGRELQLYERRIVPEILGRGGEDASARVDGRPRLVRAALQMGGMGGGMGNHGGDGGHSYGGQGPPSSGTKGKLESGGAGLARFGLLGEPEPVAAADLDFDGRITRAEFATRADQRFAHLDEAETGRLTYPDLERRLRANGQGGRPGGGGPSGGDRRGRRGGHGGGSGGGGPGDGPSA